MERFDFLQEIDICAYTDIDWKKIDNKTIMITGASGMVGKYLIQVILRRNELQEVGTRIIAVGRNKNNFLTRMADIKNLDNVIFLEQDVQKPFQYNGHLDYIIHMASNTHPRAYALDPIGTEMTNILGTYYLLDLVSKNPGCRFLFTSSGDIYGDNRSEKKFLSENDCGYIDCNTLRAGYIEGKRASEALCNAFKESKNVDFVIARLCRIYGPSINLSDSKAITQFIKKAVSNENIVLKSLGNQIFSYLYIFDVVTALLTIITKGKNGEAYNVAENEQVISLRNLAEILAKIGNCDVIMDLPDDIESKGASSFQNVQLDASKLYQLGWKSQISLFDGLEHTVKELRKK